MLRFCSAIRENVCPDPETFEKFLGFARMLPGYPANNQYLAYIAFMTKVLGIDLYERYGIDLRKMGQQAPSGH
ncbi:MAG TPA: hypothetical protein VN366_08195 [Feifaniaceae bacterium]|nr:hypothetical protein [Feifaniaceae bacterium]